ncbi:hypothetical protein [Tessaracoccus flavus]
MSVTTIIELILRILGIGRSRTPRPAAQGDTLSPCTALPCPLTDGGRPP